MAKQSEQTSLIHQKFGKRFIEDHAGRIISDPEIALVELVANSWDAGAKNVKITWPDDENEIFEIKDDGTGMTESEFREIWPEFNYNRLKDKGNKVEFPLNNVYRNAYGKNGKGRHAMFCFSDEYFVETCKNGSCSSFSIKKSYGDNVLNIKPLEKSSLDCHGTKILCNVTKNHLSEERVIELLGSKFITDPDFKIKINGNQIDLFNLMDITDERLCKINDEETVQILKIDSKKAGKTTQQHGVAWWVNNRLVKEQSWKESNLAYLDGRTNEAKRFTFIVNADILQNDVEQDWTGFKNTDLVKAVQEKVRMCILDLVDDLLDEIRSSKRIKALKSQRDDLVEMSPSERGDVLNFVKEVQKTVPTINDSTLAKTLQVFMKMEKARSGFTLLQQLVNLSPNEIDDLSEILDMWSVADAKRVLNELHLRLEIIKDIEKLMDDPKTDELHQLHPLFERGLWIFGPEYDGVEFMSNRQLLTVLKDYLVQHGMQLDHTKLTNPRKRPDFVVVPNQLSLGAYYCNHYDTDDGEPDGFDKVLIVELKRGGSTINIKERRQAEDYANEIINCGKIQTFTKIVCYVLGSEIRTDRMESGNVTVIPISFTAVLNKAHSRTFNLLKKIQEVKGITDEEAPEIKEVLSETTLSDF